MIDLRRKRTSFHQSIRFNQRAAFRAKVRQRLNTQQKRQQIILSLNEALQFWLKCEQGKQMFWSTQFLPNEKQYKCAFSLIDSTCQRIKLIMCQHERDEDSRIEICNYLLQNLPLLFPIDQVGLRELPASLIELVMYVLKDTMFSDQQKEEFVSSLPYETVNRCLLGYFIDNWEEFRQNQCNDLMMSFFRELTKFKDIFGKQAYNSGKFEFLLNLIVEDILQVTQQERMIYQGLQGSQGFIDSYFNNEGLFYQQQYTTKNPCLIQPENKLLYVIKNSTFLCNLLLLSPVSNYNIKEAKPKLNVILNYLYRTIFLSQANFNYRHSGEFCISVLINATVDSCSHNNYLQMIEDVLKNGVKRQNDKQRDKQKEKYIQKQFETLDCQFNENEIVPISTVNESFEDQNLNSINESSQNMLNKIKLLMLFSTSQELQTLKFEHIEKWFIQMFQNQTKTIFSLQNPTLMTHLFRLLTNLLKNETHQKFITYTFNKSYTNSKNQNQLLTRIKICKLIGKKGFDQLFQHTNLKNYCSELSNFLCTMLQNLSEIGNISTFVSSLIFTQETLADSVDIERVENEGSDSEIQTDLLLDSFKSHIYSLNLKFLQRAYKYLGFKEKQKTLLNLIVVDYLSFQECKRYLTQEEREKLRKNSYFKYEQYDPDSEEEIQIQDQGNQPDQLENYMTNDQQPHYLHEKHKFYNYQAHQSKNNTFQTNQIDKKQVDWQINQNHRNKSSFNVSNYETEIEI